MAQNLTPLPLPPPPWHVTDFHTDVIDRRDPLNPDNNLFDVDVVPSPCDFMPGRPDRALLLQAASGSSTPVSIFGRLTNFDTFPFCLAFTVTIVDNDPLYLMNVVDRQTGERMASLFVGNDRIVFTLGGTTVTFPAPVGGDGFTSAPDDVIHFQICVNSDGQPTFYVNCQPVVPSPAINELFQPVDTSNSIFYFMNNGTAVEGSSSQYTV